MEEEHTHTESASKKEVVSEQSESSSEKANKKKERSPITLKSIWTWMKKNKTFLLILIPIILSIYLRAMPLALPITDTWAEQSVEQSLKGQLSSQSYQQFPHLDDEKRAEYVNAEWEKFKVQNPDQITSSIEETSQFFKSRLQDDDGNTYLLAIDPYLWYGNAKNYVEKGMPGDLEIDGKYYYTLRDGRFNDGIGFTPIAFFHATLYKFVHFFNKDISLMFIAFLMPIILVSLATIPAYMIGKEMAGDAAGLIAGSIVAFHTSLLNRTIGGFSDNDPFNVFFPLVILWFALFTIDAKTTKKKLIWGTATALAMAMYRFLWSGYWFMYIFIALLLICYAIYKLVLHWREHEKVPGKEIAQYGYTLGLFYIGAALLNGILNGLLGRNVLTNMKMMLQSPLSAVGFTELKQVAQVDIWPNVLTTVAELNQASVSSVLSTFGGVMMFVIALSACIFAINKGETKKQDLWWYGASILYFFFIFKLDGQVSLITFLVLLAVPLTAFVIKSWYEKKELPMQYGMIILIWFGATIYASNTSIRFLALITPIFAIGFGVTIVKVGSLAGQWSEKALSIKKEYMFYMVIVLCCLLLISPFTSAVGLAKQQVPSFNDAWKESLDVIKNDADDGIITSWWDFGHWFVAMGERRVTFDGGNQGNRIHWVGKLLLEDDEETSVGILKMLNCGQEYAYQKLIEYNPKGKIDSINTLYTLSNEPREQAKEILLGKGLSDGEAEEVLELTHCELLPQYLIASEDMVQKAGVWGHFGSWNFTRAEMYNRVKKVQKAEGTQLLETEYNVSSEESSAIYDQIKQQSGDEFVAGWPGYASGRVSCQIQRDMIQCPYGNNNVGVVNATSMEAWIVVNQQGIARPHSLVYADDKDVHEKTYSDASNYFSIVLIPTGGGFDSVLVSKEHAKSLFLRLFFYEGHGLKHVELLSDKRSFSNQRIQVWKVHWDEQEPIKIFQQKEQVADEGQ